MMDLIFAEIGDISAKLDELVSVNRSILNRLDGLEALDPPDVLYRRATLDDGRGVYVRDPDGHTAGE